MKSSYTRGLMLLILACVLMHAFAKLADDVCLLYHMLESFGYYTGYLHTKLTVPLWIVLFISIPALIYFAFKLIWKDKSFTTRKSQIISRVILFCLIALSIYSYFTIVPAVHVMVLRSSKGVDSVVYQRRTFPFAMNRENSPSGITVSTELLLKL